MQNNLCHKKAILMCGTVSVCCLMREKMQIFRCASKRELNWNGGENVKYHSKCWIRFGRPIKTYTKNQKERKTQVMIEVNSACASENRSRQIYHAHGSSSICLNLQNRDILSISSGFTHKAQANNKAREYNFWKYLSLEINHFAFHCGFQLDIRLFAIHPLTLPLPEFPLYGWWWYKVFFVDKKNHGKNEAKHNSHFRHKAQGGGEEKHRFDHFRDTAAYWDTI